MGKEAKIIEVINEETELEIIPPKNEIEIEQVPVNLNIPVNANEIKYKDNINNKVDNVQDALDDVFTEFKNMPDFNNFVQDENYVHTDNNYTDEDKQKLDSLENISGNASNITYEDTTGQGVDNVQSAVDEAFNQIESINNKKINGKDIPYEDDYGYGTPDNIQEALDFAFEELDNRPTDSDISLNYVSCTMTQNLNTTKQNRARTNIGIPQTCIMYNQVQTLSEGNKNVARYNIGVRAFRNLGEIDLSDYDDDVWTFIDTLIEEGTYKFIENADYFTYIVETWWLGDYQLGQKYFYVEEGYTYQYYRNGYYDEDNDEISWDSWTYYITDDVATQLFAPKSHVHFTTINTPYEIRDYLDKMSNFSLKDTRVTSTANKHVYMVRVDYTNYTTTGGTKYVRYQEYYDIEEPSKIYKRTGLSNGNTTASTITWGDWYVFEGVSE